MTKFLKSTNYTGEKEKKSVDDRQMDFRVNRKGSAGYPQTKSFPLIIKKDVCKCVGVSLSIDEPKVGSYTETKKQKRFLPTLYVAHVSNKVHYVYIYMENRKKATTH